MANNAAEFVEIFNRLREKVQAVKEASMFQVKPLAESALADLDALFENLDQRIYALEVKNGTAG